MRLNCTWGVQKFCPASWLPKPQKNQFVSIRNSSNILSLYVILGCTNFSFELVVTPAWVPCFFSKINLQHVFIYLSIKSWSYLFQDVLLIILEVLLRWLIALATKVRKTSLLEMVYVILSPRLVFLGFWMSELCWISYLSNFNFVLHQSGELIF